MMPNDDTLDIRRATYDDLPTIIKQRTAMFADIGVVVAGDPQTVFDRSLAWTQTMFDAGHYHGWLVYDASTEAVVGGAGVWLMATCPNPLNTVAMTAYVLNVYVEPDFRGQGWARQLMEAIITFCRKQGITTLSLHASDAGRSLYASLGFESTNEMRMDLL